MSFFKRCLSDNNFQSDFRENNILTKIIIGEDDTTNCNNTATNQKETKLTELTEN